MIVGWCCSHIILYGGGRLKSTSSHEAEKYNIKTLTLMELSRPKKAHSRFLNLSTSNFIKGAQKQFNLIILVN